MNIYKKLASDTILMTIGTFSSKVLVFLMLPLYTFVLTTEEYGVADLFITTVNLLIPVLTISISEATFRFAFDKHINQNKNITNSFFCIVLSLIVLLPLTLLLSKWNINFKYYGEIFVLLYFVHALNTCFSNYARGTNHIKTFVFSSVIYTLFLVVLNVIFLTVIKIGLYGYFFAMISAYLASSVYIVISLKGWKIIKIKYLDMELFKDMIRFSIPMIFSTTAWWAMNSIDKYMLIDWYGIETSGLYGVAQKLPTIISVLSSIFVQAWQISAISIYGNKETNSFYTNVYKIYETSLFLAAALIILLTKPLALIMFQKDYFSAYIFAPILIIAGIYSSLSSFLQSPFVAEKKSGVLLKTTLYGLVFNIIANIIFLNLMGPVGATYATLLGFGITFITRLYLSKKFVDIDISWPKTILSSIIIFLEAIVISYDVHYSNIIAFILFVFIMILHYSNVKSFAIALYKLGINKLTRRNKNVKI